MTNYTQHDEQEHILAALASIHPTRGRFLDVGAYCAKDLSNTRALYELGWSGVMVEPSPEPFAALLREYGRDPRITLICAALVCSGPSLQLLHTTADALSTVEGPHAEAHLKLWGEVGGFYGKFLTPTIRWPDLLFIGLGPFDFVSIDTEGTSVALFREFLHEMRGGPRPTAIIVEHENTEPVATAAAIDAGYRLAHLTRVNALYVREA